jgi:hypothetical protein
MIEERTGPRWVWALVVLGIVVGVAGGWWLYGVVAGA